MKLEGSTALISAVNRGLGAANTHSQFERGAVNTPRRADPRPSRALDRLPSWVVNTTAAITSGGKAARQQQTRRPRSEVWLRLLEADGL